VPRLPGQQAKPTGLQGLLATIDGKKKMTTMEKSKHDWANFKSTQDDHTLSEMKKAAQVHDVDEPNTPRPGPSSASALLLACSNGQLPPACATLVRMATWRNRLSCSAPTSGRRRWRAPTAGGGWGSRIDAR